jgi:hypothetical protein
MPYRTLTDTEARLFHLTAACLCHEEAERLSREGRYRDAEVEERHADIHELKALYLARYGRKAA